VLLDKIQIHQVITNLIRNSVDALDCQTACNLDPRSASNFDPLGGCPGSA
jgi:C4-dicarboxylate-specific signal transduction histidine kinase